MKHASIGMAAGAALALCALHAPASAQTVVIGSSNARLCYEAALLEPATRRASLERCESALSDDVLTRRDVAATHVNYGILLFRAGRSDDALRSYDRAISLRPELGEAWHNRGIVHMATGNHEEAGQDFTRALETGFAEPHKAHFNRALTFDARGLYREAYDDFQRALQLRPGWDLPLDELARYEVVDGSR